MARPDRLEALLHEVCVLASAVWWGMPGWRARVQEMSDGGLPSGGDGSMGASGADPVSSQLDERGRRRMDPAERERRDLERAAEACQRAMSVLWNTYARTASTRVPPARMEDPGCEMCAMVPDHWCPTYVTIETPVNRKGRPLTKKMRLCFWCYRRQRPSEQGGWGRLPSHDEVQAHAEGRRVRRSA